MFTKKKNQVEEPKKLTPQKIEEVPEETTEPVKEKVVPEEPKELPKEDLGEEETEEGLTEEMVSNSLLNHEERLRRLEHHLRLDF